MENKSIPFYSLDFQHAAVKESLEDAFARVMEGGWFIRGQALEEFERAFADFSATRFSVGVGNGLDALTIALMAAGVKPGDEVIVPSHTYIASWLAVSRVGAHIVPVEPDERTMNMDPKKISSALTAKTKAIMPVHLYGQACDMGSIKSIAERHGMFIVEDNAQSQGSTWNQKPTGGWGVVNATSFYPTKNLGALGDGGAITTNDENIALLARQLGNYGFQSRNIAVMKGFNSRLDELQAAILSIKLMKVRAWINLRRQIAEKYNEQLSGVGDIILPWSSPEAYHTYHLFIIRTAHRDGLHQHLQRNNIDTQIHYPVPVHLQKAYADLNFRRGDFPQAELLADTVLSLPIWPGMTDEQIEKVTASIRDFFDHL